MKGTIDEILYPKSERDSSRYKNQSEQTDNVFSKVHDLWHKLAAMYIWQSRSCVAMKKDNQCDMKIEIW